MEELPEESLAHAGERGFGFYVHVPFCSVRCGYCDFNTYTAEELGAGLFPGASRTTYAAAAVDEVRRARRALGDRDLPVSTVFFGGGTPTLLSPADLTSVVAAIGAEFGLVPGAEVTTEANPDSVGPADLAGLRAGGVNRVSFGMQSAVDHVLRVLDRTHDPRRVPEVVAWARAAGFEQRQPGPHLRDAGGVGGRLGVLARRGTRLRARPRLGVLAHRRGRHRAGPPGPPGRGADARRRRPGRQVPARRPAARVRGPRLVRGVELGHATSRRAAATTCSTGPAATGGGSVRARTRTWRGRGGGTSSTRWRTPSGWRPAGARRTTTRCSTPRPGGSSGSCWSCGCATGLPIDALDGTGREAVPKLEDGPAGRRRRGPFGAHPAGPVARRRGRQAAASLTGP